MYTLKVCVSQEDCIVGTIFDRLIYIAHRGWYFLSGENQKFLCFLQQLCLHR